MRFNQLSTTQQTNIHSFSICTFRPWRQLWSLLFNGLVVPSSLSAPIACNWALSHHDRVFAIKLVCVAWHHICSFWIAFAIIDDLWGCHRETMFWILERSCGVLPLRFFFDIVWFLIRFHVSDDFGQKCASEFNLGAFFLLVYIIFAACKWNSLIVLRIENCECLYAGWMGSMFACACMQLRVLPFCLMFESMSTTLLFSSRFVTYWRLVITPSI